MKEKEKLQDNRLRLEKLRECWDLGTRFYNRDFKKIRLLDASDRGEFWTAINAQFPKYQILPDTNFVAYIKNNLLASIYSVAKSAEVIANSEEDREFCTNINVALDWVWDTCHVSDFQFEAGERCALANLGITQVGWDESLYIGSKSSQIKGQVCLKNIDPLKFMRDPYAVNLDSSAWCCTYEDLHRTAFLNHPRYKEAFEAFLKADGSNAENTPANPRPGGISTNGAKDYYTLTIWWTKNDHGGIDEIHEVNHSAILYTKNDIKPNMYPFALCYCNLPAGALIGTSEPAKIFANCVAYNMLDSLALTSEYKNQFPPRFVSDQSKLNVQAFAKHGNEADKTFIVSGDATRAVHYHQYPQVSNIVPTMKQSLEYGIQNVTGVDGRYTGRDTGSIITTGGTEEMLNRVTLIDTPKIHMYENYCMRLTELILKNMICFCPKRKFFRQQKNSTKYETITVDFPKIDDDTLFSYRIAISSELPKNKQRIAAMATELLKAQAQYNQNGTNTVSWITEEEWLGFQDLPMKEYLMERMGVQRWENALEEVAQVLYNYANLIQQGLDNDSAMQATADALVKTRRGEPPVTQTAGNDPALETMAAGGTV